MYDFFPLFANVFLRVVYRRESTLGMLATAYGVNQKDNVRDIPGTPSTNNGGFEKVGIFW